MNEAPDTGQAEEALDFTEFLLTPETDNSEEADEATDIDEDAAVEAEAEADADDVEDIEEDDPDDEPEEDDDDPLFAVTIDGQSQELSLSELTNGYLRRADYTRKTQELAEKVKASEAQAAQSSELERRYEAALTEWAVQNTNDPDWVSLSQRLTPQQFQVEQAKWNQHKGKVEQAKATLGQLRNQRQEETAARVLEAIPEWRDQSVAAKELGDLVAHAEGFGFSQQEITNMMDPRVFLLLRAAVQGAKAKNSTKQTKAAAEKRVAQVAKQVPPRGRASKGQSAKAAKRKAMDALRQTGSDEAFVDFLLAGD